MRQCFRVQCPITTLRSLPCTWTILVPYPLTKAGPRGPEARAERSQKGNPEFCTLPSSVQRLSVLLRPRPDHSIPGTSLTSCPLHISDRKIPRLRFFNNATLSLALSRFDLSSYIVSHPQHVSHRFYTSTRLVFHHSHHSPSPLDKAHTHYHLIIQSTYHLFSCLVIYSLPPVSVCASPKVALLKIRLCEHHHIRHYVL